MTYEIFSGDCLGRRFLGADKNEEALRIAREALESLELPFWLSWTTLPLSCVALLGAVFQ